MDLKDYFENSPGTGVLATSDDKGRVNAALYARPHVMQDGTLAFIMADRLTRHNLQLNPHAAYLFLERGPGYRGTRLVLTMVRESSDRALIEELRRRTYSPEDEAKVGDLFLVHFQLDEQLALLGRGPES